MNWQQECKSEHAISVEILREAGRCPFRLHVYPPATSKAQHELVWMEPEGLSDENRERLRRMNATWRIHSPTAVLMTSDTWQTDSQKFSRHFGIPLNLPYEEFQKRYSQVLDEKFDGTLANVPNEVKIEAVVTMIKGPKIGQFSELTFYRRKQSRIIITETRDTTNYYGQLNLIPDWWDRTIQ